MSYSSRRDFSCCAKDDQRSCKWRFNSSAINEELISSYLSTSDYPDPELLIRTSGENRVRIFNVAIGIYRALFYKILWPDFKKKNFYKAIFDYQKRKKIWKTSEQLLDSNE